VCRQDEQQRSVAAEGDGARILAARHPDGHWGPGFHQPEWACSHYSLLDLRNLVLEQAHSAARVTVALILEENLGAADVTLTGDAQRRITEAADSIQVVGDRYPEAMQRMIDR
jgi:hypothetical protein